MKNQILKRVACLLLRTAIGLVLFCSLAGHSFASTGDQAETARPAAAPEGSPVFNGHDLTGWTNLNGGKFSAANGVLHLDASTGWLCTVREFTNFVFEAECRALETNYNSGFFLRAGLDGKPFPTNAWQVNLKQSALGALLHGRDTVVSNALPAKPVGEWFTFRITVNGRSAALDADGKPLWRCNALDVQAGRIGVQAEGKSFEFRNLRVTETGTNQAGH